MALSFCTQKGEKKDVEMRTCEGALELAREYDNNPALKKRTKLVDSEGVAKHHNINIMLYEPKGTEGKAQKIWQIVYGKYQHKKDLFPLMHLGKLT